MKYIIQYYLGMILPDAVFLKLQFKRAIGYFPNFNFPKTFNEKMQWLKLNDRSELRTITSDKFKGREYINEFLDESKLIPIYFKTNDVNDLDSSNIDKFPCIIKANHDCGSYIILKDSKNIDWKKIQLYFAKKLKINYYYISQEWQYSRIERNIIVEKLLVDVNGDVPMDYKFWCFNGVAKFLVVDIDRGKPSKSRNWYDMDWNLLDINWETDTKLIDIKLPNCLEEMKKLSESLAKKFSFVRIDWYVLENSFYIGEITHSPAGGMAKFEPNKWDRIMGDYLRLPIES